MVAQGRTLELLRLAGVVGIITAIALSLSDISLLYGLLILFGFSTALLWNGGREPQRGGQTTFA